MQNLQTGSTGEPSRAKTIRRLESLVVMVVVVYVVGMSPRQSYSLQHQSVSWRWPPAWVIGQMHLVGLSELFWKSTINIFTSRAGEAQCCRYIIRSVFKASRFLSFIRFPLVQPQATDSDGGLIRDFSSSTTGNEWLRNLISFLAPYVP